MEVPGVLVFHLNVSLLTEGTPLESMFLDGRVNKSCCKTIHYSDILRLAVPMTLNNLAGGVAGGAAGVEPVISGIMALIASFTMMDLGYKLGSRLGTSIGDKIDTHIISSCIFVGLAFASFTEYAE